MKTLVSGISEDEINLTSTSFSYDDILHTTIVRYQLSEQLDDSQLVAMEQGYWEVLERRTRKQELFGSAGAAARNREPSYAGNPAFLREHSSSSSPLLVDQQQAQGLVVSALAAVLIGSPTRSPAHGGSAKREAAESLAQLGGILKSAASVRVSCVVQYLLAADEILEHEEELLACLAEFISEDRKNKNCKKSRIPTTTSEVVDLETALTAFCRRVVISNSSSTSAEQDQDRIATSSSSIFGCCGNLSGWAQNLFFRNGLPIETSVYMLDQIAVAWKLIFRTRTNQNYLLASFLEAYLAALLLFVLRKVIAVRSSSRSTAHDAAPFLSATPNGLSASTTTPLASEVWDFFLSSATSSAGSIGNKKARHHKTQLGFSTCTAANFLQLLKDLHADEFLRKEVRYTVSSDEDDTNSGQLDDPTTSSEERLHDFLETYRIQTSARPVLRRTLSGELRGLLPFERLSAAAQQEAVQALQVVEQSRVVMSTQKKKSLLRFNEDVLFRPFLSLPRFPEDTVQEVAFFLMSCRNNLTPSGETIESRREAQTLEAYCDKVKANRLLSGSQYTSESDQKRLSPRTASKSTFPALIDDTLAGPPKVFTGTVGIARYEFAVSSLYCGSESESTPPRTDDWPPGGASNSAAAPAPQLLRGLWRNILRLQYENPDLEHHIFADCVLQLRRNSAHA
ncbi:unnamed protein product [Amoebophrya sp. A120]|nr:unnamed protein product [Amoebophrya sp. A120]|eukprot:GSA120T00020875001.1